MNRYVCVCVYTVYIYDNISLIFRQNLKKKTKQAIDYILITNLMH